MKTITITDETTGYDLAEAISSNFSEEMKADDNTTASIDNGFYLTREAYGLGEGFRDWDILFDHWEDPLVPYFAKEVFRDIFAKVATALADKLTKERGSVVTVEEAAEKVTDDMLDQAYRERGRDNPHDIAIDYLTDVQKNANLWAARILDQMAREAARDKNDEQREQVAKPAPDASPREED